MAAIKRSWRPDAFGIIRHFIVYSAVIIAVFPLIWVFLTSIKSPGDMITIPPSIIFRPTFEHYITIGKQGFLKYLTNSLVIAISSSLVVVALSTPAAYGLSRMHFRGREQLTFGIFALRFIPYVSVILPLYLIMLKFGLVGTHLGVVLAQQTRLMPFVIWLLRGFFLEIPGNLEEAAMVQGCSRWGAFVRIAIPLVAPALGAALILSFIFAWNEYLVVLVLSGRNAQTLTLGLAKFLGGEEYGMRWGPLSAWASVVVFPVIVFVFLVGKQFIRGFSGKTE